MKNNTESGHISINSKQLYYEIINSKYIDGDKPILVFLHEGLGSCAQWKDFPYEISNQLQLPVFMYDRYGYGKSEILSEARSEKYLEDEAENWLPKVFKACKLDKFQKILIGHSDGGTIALIAASLFPENILVVITEAAHVFVEEKTHKNVLPVKDFYENGGLKEKLQKYHHQNTEKMFYGWYNVWSNRDFINWNVEHLLKNINCPILAIQGKDDEYGTVEQLQSISQNTSSETQILFIDDCAHTPHHQARDQVLTEMINFISNL